MLTDNTVAFLIRCAAWALVGWAVWSQPIVKTQARGYHEAWVAAWRVDAGDCDVRAYGLVFRHTCEEEDR